MERYTAFCIFFFFNLKVEGCLRLKSQQCCRLNNQQTIRNPFENIAPRDLELSWVTTDFGRRHSVGCPKMTSYQKVTKCKPPERLPTNWQKSITDGQKSRSLMECGPSVCVIIYF